MDLHPKRCHVTANVGAECLGNRCQERAASLPGGIAGRAGHIRRQRGVECNGPRRIGQATHGHQHAPDVGKIDNRVVAVRDG